MINDHRFFLCIVQPNYSITTNLPYCTSPVELVSAIEYIPVVNPNVDIVLEDGMKFRTIFPENEAIV